MQSKEITPFAFGDHLVRVVSDADGNPWFIAKDVAKALEYPVNSLNQPNNLFKHVPEEWKGHNPIMVRSGNGIDQIREMFTLSEPGLYFFLGRSDKPGALPFQKWLAGEVLPAIRKTGFYVYAMPGVKTSRAFQMPEDLPPSALALKPSLRQRLWRDALDTARLDGGDLSVAVQWFDRLCRMMACAQALPASRSPLVSRFFAECCVGCPGSRVRATRLYEAMRQWLKGKDEEMPSMKVFGESMRQLARLIRSNGTWYLDIALR